MPFTSQSADSSNTMNPDTCRFWPKGATALLLVLAVNLVPGSVLAADVSATPGALPDSLRVLGSQRSAVAAEALPADDQPLRMADQASAFPGEDEVPGQDQAPRGATAMLAPAFQRIEQDDPVWIFSGSWTSHTLSAASGGSYWRNATAFSSAELQFEGSWVSVGFIADRFSGEAEVLIDGVSQGVIDLYRNGSASEAMPVSVHFEGLAPGLHSLSIQVLGTSSPLSSNTRVQLDYVDYGDGSLLPDGQFEEDDERLLISNGWTTVAYAGAGGERYIRATAGTAWFPFAGDSFSLHTIAYVNGGKARLYVDGFYLDTIDLFEPVFQGAAIPRVFSYQGFGLGPHVLQISTYENTTTIDQLVTPGSGPFIDPDPPVTGITRFEADHPSIRYNGLPFFQAATSWVRVANIVSTRASAGEYVYSATVDDLIEFDFEGDWLGIGFATDRFGGQAEIAINGELLETIDLYTRYEDTASRYYRDLGPGPHTVSITVLGSARPGASGARVHLDFFDVWGGQPMAEGTFEEDSERLVFSYGWSRANDANASGGAYAFSGVNADATVWFPFTGDSVTWQGFTRFSYADVDVRLNGVSLGLLDMYGYVELPRAFSFNDLGPGPHVLEVRRYRNESVTIDAFMTPAIGPDREPPEAAAFARLEENHPSMRYNGEPYRTMPQTWARQSGMQSSAAYNLTSSTPGDVWSLDFDGDWINLGFRSTASSGTAEVFIDGVSRGLIDTANGVNDVKNFIFDQLGAGSHTLEVVVVSGPVMPDSVDLWNGEASAAGWHEPQLEGEMGGQFNLSNRRWWVIGSDIYARSGDFLRPFVSANTNLWFTLTGSDLSLLSYQRANTSIQVLINGVDYGLFDLSTTPPFRAQPTALHFPDLGDGPHVVHVALFSIGGSTPVIDAFEVNPDGFFSYMPEILWYDTTAQESLPGAANTGFVSTIAIGDLNGDGIVSLVAPGVNGRLYVYRGDGQDAGNGTPIQWTSDLAGPAAEPALADLTGDGKAEIVLVGRDGTFAFRHDGQLLWSNPEVFSHNPGEDFGWGGPSIGNLDLGPEPEIVIAAYNGRLYVLDHEGVIQYSRPLGGRWPTVPLLADITGDGILDIVVAHGWTIEVIDYFNGRETVWTRTLPDPIGVPSSYGTFGGPAVADLTGDGRPEIIINWGHVIEALRDDGTVLWRYQTNRNDLFRPSPITVADVTGDGEVNLVTASAVTLGFLIPHHLLMVFDRDGNLLWEQTVGDNSASASGVAAQDLTGNGAWEILWNGAQDGFLILNGADGKRLFNEPWTGSGTIVDYPTLADLNGDGQAEIVTSGRNGIFVIGHPGRWADSRPVWNQHSYHINNINNDWSVPFVEQNSWQLHNTYRTQTPERDPACASADGALIPPRFVQLSPDQGVVLPSGVELVVSGRVIPVNAAQPLLNVWVDDRPVDLLDTSGSFFATVALESGANSLRVVAADRCGPAETELLLIGGGDTSNPWTDLGDASVLLEARFTSTTHDRANERVLVDVQAFNPGSTLPGPVLMAIGGDADPSLGLLNADGFTPQGEPYVVIVPAGDALPGGVLSPARELALANPRRGPIDFTPRWIVPVNQPPYFTSMPNTRATQGQAWQYLIGAADGNDDPLSYELLIGPPGMSLIGTSLAWTPTQTGNFQIELQVADGRGGTARQGFTLGVVDGSFNSPPVFVSTPSVQSPIGATYQYAAVAVDADGDALSFSLLVAPAGMAVNGGTGQLSWSNAQPGQHSVVLRVEDGRGGQASQAWTLFVGEPAGTPAGPAFSSVPPGFAAVGTQYRYVYSLNHGGNAPPLVSLVEAPATMQLDASSRVLTWVPGVADLGTRTVELLAVDSNGLQARQRFELQVLASLPNQAPYFISTPVTTARIGAAYSYAAEAIDPEFQPLSWSLTSAPAGMSVNAETGEISWLPVAPQPAQVAVSLQASDGQGGLATQDFLIQMRAANSPPVISGNPPSSVIAGQFYSTRILASDADGDPLQFRLLQGPAGMSLHPTLGWLHWTTTGAAPGVYPVVLEVLDGWGGRDELAFSVTVLVDDQPPVVSIQMQREPACRGETVNVCVEASDNVGISALGLNIDGQDRSLDPSRCYLWTPQQAGLFPALAQATDPSGLVGSASRNLPVADCNDEQRPVVSLLSPLPDSAHNLPVPIIASIEDNTPEILTWTVSLRREEDGEAEILASGSGPVNAAEVAVFDPTRLAPGTYFIDILGNDGAQTGGIRFRLNSAEGFKPGRIAFTAVDLTWSLGAFPLAIGRAYDSLDAAAAGTSCGDFSPGWRLALSASVSDSAANAPPSLTGFGALMTAEPFNSLTRVNVVKPSGERVGFTFDPQPKTFPSVFQFDVAFKPDAGVTDTLRAVDGPAVVWLLGAGFADYLIPYNPSLYELETEGGVIYLISEQEGLKEIRDPLGGVVTVTPEGFESSWGARVEYERDSVGRISAIVLLDESRSEIGRLVYGYGANGNLVSFTDLAGGVSTFEYADPAFPHHLTGMFDALGNPIARTVFDEDGRMIAHCPGSADPQTLQGCSLFEFDAAGGSETIFDGRGFRSELFYNERGQVVFQRDEIEPEVWVEQSWTYDERGHVVEYIDGDGGITLTTRDELGRRLSEIEPDGRSWTWTWGACRDEDQWLERCDALGNCTTQEFNSDCEITRHVDPLGGETLFEYDARGQRSGRIDPTGQRIDTEFDARGLLRSLTDGSSGQIVNTHDPLGQQLSETERTGIRRDWTYDSGARVESETWQGAGVGNSNITWSHNVNNLINSIGWPEGEISLTYWPNGKVRRMTHTSATAPDWWIEYSYDISNNVIRLEDSFGGITEYDYNGLNQLVEIRQHGAGVLPKRVMIDSSNTGQPLQMRRYASLDDSQPGPITDFEYGCLSCPTTLSRIAHRRSDQSLIHDLVYQRNPIHQIVGRSDQDGDHSYVYDGRGWLIEATHPPGFTAGNQAFVWDGAGNWLSRSGNFGGTNAATISYQQGLGGHRLQSDSVNSYQYDARGALIERSGPTGRLELDRDGRGNVIAIREFNAANQLVSSAAYAYSSNQQRVRAEREGVVRHYIFDGPNPIIALNASGQVIWRQLHVRDADRPLAMEVGGELIWLLSDHIGSVREQVGNSGQVVASFSYDAFGRQLSGPAASLDDPVRYTGREFDLPGGLGYYRLRLYDPAIGRFLSEDSIEPWHYRYAENNPLSLLDPSGAVALLEFALEVCNAVAFAKSPTGEGEGAAVGFAFAGNVEALKAQIRANLKSAILPCWAQ